MKVNPAKTAETPPILTGGEVCLAVRPGSRLALSAAIALPLLLSMLLVPAAEAQARPLIQIQVSGAPSDFTIRKSHGTTDYVFTISFTCLSGQEYGPCTSHQLAETDVQVTPVLTPEEPPTGWEVKADTAAFRMKAKESRTILVTVRLLDDEPEKPGFGIGLSARGQPITNPTIDPLLGGTLAQATSDSDQVSVEKVLNWGESLSSLARRFMWPLLFAAAILLVTGVVLVERKRGSLDVSCDNPRQSISPGRGASFPVTLRNEAKTDDRVHLALTELPPGWTAIVPLNEIELRGGERTQMWVTVRAPPDATPDATVGFKLRARSLRGQRSSEVDLGVTVVGDSRPQDVEDVVAPPPPPPIDYSTDAPATEPYRAPTRPKARRK